MSEVEKLHFKVGLSGTYWDKKPAYSVAINDQVCISGVVDVSSNEVFYVEFDAEVVEGLCSLKIRLENKTDSDVQKDCYNTEDFNIINDMLLNITSVEIDDISLGNLLYTHSSFTGDEPQRPVLDKCVNLGWNGTWELLFSSPIYIWLLENI